MYCAKMEIRFCPPNLNVIIWKWKIEYATRETKVGCGIRVKHILWDLATFWLFGKPPIVQDRLELCMALLCCWFAWLSNNEAKLSYLCVWSCFGIAANIINLIQSFIFLLVLVLLILYCHPLAVYCLLLRSLVEMQNENIFKRRTELHILF